MEDLEIMRRQMAEMKERLDSQQIVNQTLLRKIMRHKASWLNKLVIGEIIAIPITYFFLAAFSAMVHISQWYAFCFLVLAAVDTFIDWKTVRIPPKIFSQASMLDLKKFLLRQMRLRFIQVMIATPLVIIWQMAFFLSLPVDESAPDFIRFPAVSGLIGGIIGTIIGFVIIIVLYIKMQRTNANLVRDIQELEED